MTPPKVIGRAIRRHERCRRSPHPYLPPRNSRCRLRSPRHNSRNSHLAWSSAMPPGIDEGRAFVPVRIAVMTVSDTRTAANDTSGDTLEARIKEAGHVVVARLIMKDDRAQIALQLRRW